jgi:phosphoserine phosphatase
MPEDRRLRMVFTTDVNGTTTPENTFGELVRPDNRHRQMVDLMNRYTTGAALFSEILPQMRSLADRVDRARLESYARKLPLFPGVKTCLNRLGSSHNVACCMALSTTGFSGLMALVNKYHHDSMMYVAASEVLVHLLTPAERKCLIRPIAEETDKVRILQDLIKMYRPDHGLLFHVGDTLGDFPAIVFAAKNDGLGIAFCPNDALNRHVRELAPEVRKNIAVILPHPKNGPDYAVVCKVIEDRVREIFRTQL